MTFHLTIKAKSDLIDIARYTEQQWGKKQRDIYLKLIDDAFCNLAQMPGIGNPCDYIRTGYRKHVVGKHLIFYRTIDSDEIQIVRVLHGNMDVEDHLST